MEKYKNTALPAAERAADLVSRMTLREKVGQLNQRLCGFRCYEINDGAFTLTDEIISEIEKWGGLGVLYGLYRADAWSGRTFQNGLSGSLAIKAYNAVQRCVIEHSRFGIPVLMSTECPHGHQALDGYLLPTALSMGATFDPKLVREAFGVCAKQLKTMGVQLALVSLLDVLRDPRWGRSEECFSEDPFLCSALARAAVRGFQDDNGVGVVAKHFCAQGACTGGINAAPAVIGERELREIFLPPMKACCKAGVDGCMAAYNEIDGVPCHANPKLLKDILRGEFGFDGLVMADGVAIDRLAEMTGEPEKAGALALKSGVDVSLWDDGFTRLEKAVSDGYVLESDVDRAAERVIAYKITSGVFDSPYLDEKNELKSFAYKDYPQSLQLARESCVLLKNKDGMLPLCGNIKRLAVIGPNADSVYALCGDYTPQVNGGTTVLQGLRDIFGESVSYVKGCNTRGVSVNEIEAAVRVAEQSDAVVLVLGGTSERAYHTEFESNGALAGSENIEIDCGEGADVADLKLGGLQNELAVALFHTGKPVITVVIEGRPHELTEIAKGSKALMCVFYPGPMGGRAVAEIIAGKIAPSGRLPVSIPRSNGQLPSYYNYKDTIGSQKYVDLEKAPLYTFGSGITYTTFSYRFQSGSDTVSVENLHYGGKASFTFEITNTGGADAYAVPQLYIHGRTGSITRRVRELKGFERVFLKKGQTILITMTLSFDDLAVYNNEMSFTPEPGIVDVILSDSGVDHWRGALGIV